MAFLERMYLFSSACMLILDEDSLYLLLIMKKVNSW